MSKNLIFKNAILCDFATPGHAGKSILVNVYSGRIVVASFPSLIRLGLYVELFLEETDSVGLNLKMKLGDSVILDANIKTNPRASFDDPTVIAMQQVDCFIKNEDVVSIVISADGYNETEVMRKKICRGGIQDSVVTTT